MLRFLYLYKHFKHTNAAKTALSYIIINAQPAYWRFCIVFPVAVVPAAEADLAAVPGVDQDQGHVVAHEAALGPEAGDQGHEVPGQGQSPAQGLDQTQGRDLGQSLKKKRRLPVMILEICLGTTQMKIKSQSFVFDYVCGFLNITICFLHVLICQSIV